MRTAWIVDALNEDILSFQYDPDKIKTIDHISSLSTITTTENFRQLYNLLKISCWIRFEDSAKLFLVTGIQDVCLHGLTTENTLMFTLEYLSLSQDTTDSWLLYPSMGGWYYIKTAPRHIRGEKETSIIVDNGERVGEAQWEPDGGMDCEGAFVWVNHHNSDFKADMIPQPLYWRPLPRPFKDRYK